jgi:transposase
MSKKIIAQNEGIVIGVDVSTMKHNLAVANMRGEILKDVEIKSPDMGKWMSFLAGRLPGCRVHVVYEAGAHGFTLYDTALLLGCEATVVVAVKAEGVKTDRRDARTLAHDFLAGRTKAVVAPPFDKRVRRQVVILRDTLMKEAKRIRNIISSMKLLHGLTGPMFAARKDETGYIALCIEKLEELVKFIVAKMKEADAALTVIAREEPWAEDIKKLKGIKGVGELSAVEIALRVADMRAFSNGDKFASFLGLCPGEWSSGSARRQGHITRRGSGRLRGLLVQCAWIRIRYDEEEKARFEELRKRGGKKKAIVAIARRLAVTIWRTLAAARQAA